MLVVTTGIAEGTSLPMSDDHDRATEYEDSGAAAGLYERVAAALNARDKATAVRTAVEAVTSGSPQFEFVARETVKGKTQAIDVYKVV